MIRLAAVALLLTLPVSHLQASSLPAPAAAGTASTPIHPPFAAYWDGFKDHWGGHLKKQNGIIMLVLGVGALSLFIITRGKWNKA